MWSRPGFLLGLYIGVIELNSMVGLSQPPLVEVKVRADVVRSALLARPPHPESHPPPPHHHPGADVRNRDTRVTSQAPGTTPGQFLITQQLQ